MLPHSLPGKMGENGAFCDGRHGNRDHPDLDLPPGE